MYVDICLAKKLLLVSSDGWENLRCSCAKTLFHKNIPAKRLRLVTSDGRDVLAPIIQEVGSGAKIKYARASVCEPRLNKAGGEAHTGLINKKAFPNCTQRSLRKVKVFSTYFIILHSKLTFGTLPLKLPHQTLMKAKEAASQVF